MENSTVNYRKIFNDIIEKKYPHKKEICQPILDKPKLTVMDIDRLNKLIFEPNKEMKIANQKLKSYNEESILKILQYQKTYELNNTELAAHFKLSRNTVTKWKKLYPL